MANKNATAKKTGGGPDSDARSATEAAPNKDEKVTGAAEKERQEKTESLPSDYRALEPLPERGETLLGCTYKIDSPLTDGKALYVTINDIVLEEGTRFERRQPYEIFLNSKNVDHFQWAVAITRVASAAMRQGGDITFLPDELSSVFDPKGGYFRKGGGYMPSLVAEIGEVLRVHMVGCGLIKESALEEHQKKYLEQKRAEYESANKGGADAMIEAKWETLEQQQYLLMQKLNRAELALHATRPLEGECELHDAAKRALGMLIVYAVESRMCLDHPLVMLAMEHASRLSHGGAIDDRFSPRLPLAEHAVEGVVSTLEPVNGRYRAGLR